MSAKVSMGGKTVVITGATAGIGQAAAVELGRRGADLVLVARNPEKAKATTARIHDAAPQSSVKTVVGDLTSFGSTRTAVAGVLDSTDRIDVLVDNAGINALSSRRTGDGYDEMLQANYLGPFLFTHLLLDQVRASAPSRVVVVGSEAHRMAGAVDVATVEDLGAYSGLRAQRAYGRTKLLDMLMADELARRLDGTGVTVNSLCPGLVATDLGREAGRLNGIVSAATAIRMARTPERGARMTVRLASDPAVGETTGMFFSSTAGGGLLPATRMRRDKALAARIYERTCEVVDVAPVGTSA